MNWLAHVFLAGPDRDCRLGNLLADMVKGKARRALPPGIQRGIACHQAIDAFTDEHPIVQRSKRRLTAPYERFAGVLVDVFYDHILATDWLRYAELPLAEFTRTFYASFPTYQGDLPAEINEVLARLAAEDWLGSYATLEGIEDVLVRISQRLTQRIGRDFALQEAMSELTSQRAALSSDFHAFFPELAAHVHRWNGPFSPLPLGNRGRG
jgi:acyl carrier protein phosphodiesterase